MARILVVEDEGSIRLALEFLLRREGHEVVAVETGEEALEKASGADLVLLDLMLPGMDGFEVLTRLKAKPHPPKVVIITARGREVERAKGLALGAEGYIVKPFGLDEVLEEVRKHL